MSRVFSIVVLAGALAGVGMTACNALQTTQVTLDIRGSSLAVFTGSYETTTNGIIRRISRPPMVLLVTVRMKPSAGLARRTPTPMMTKAAAV